MVQLLLVDDNLLVGEALMSYLEEVGFGVHYASSGRDALEIAQQVPIRLVVSDIKMPGMDGTTLCRELQRLYDVPIVLMSGYIDEEDAQRMLEAGFAAVLPKPFLPNELEQRIRTILDQPTKQRPHATRCVHAQ